MAKRTLASGGVAAQPLPKSLLKRRPERESDDAEPKEEDTENTEREPTSEEKERITRVASAKSNWAGKLRPAVEEQYEAERKKGPRNIDKAVQIHNILNMLEKEEKLPAPMSDRLDKMTRPKRRK